VRVGGLVVARQRPGTARGIVFILLEDEFGTTNLVVPPDVYERHRLIVRSEPLLLAEGRLEKLPNAGGAINVFVRSLRGLDAPVGEEADIVDLAARSAASSAGANAAEGREEGLAAAAAGAVSGVADFRGVAPPVQSFAGGRRR
jgi:error-prone DNA polymerase